MCLGQGADLHMTQLMQLQQQQQQLLHNSNKEVGCSKCMVRQKHLLDIHVQTYNIPIYG